MSFLGELRRRNVIRVAVAYLVTGWLVAQVAELALESFGAPEWVMKTLLLLIALGLPFVLIFAWAFELTPEGIKREKDVDRTQSITPETGRKLNIAIIGTLAIALLLSVVTHRWTTGENMDARAVTAISTDKSIAVLPFVNMSEDPGNEYFSDGISEELLNVLVKVEGLRVASRTSSFSFKDKDTPIPEIAEALNVGHVLEGSVRKAGDTIRVTAQLIDVKTDSHLWSETYDRKLEDIFVIQDEISAHIVEALKVALGAGEAAQTPVQPTQNLQAYEDYLRGRHFWQRRGADNIRKSIELFGEATAADPAFARAWSSLGAAHLTMPTYSGEPEQDHFPLARKYARMALQLDPTIAEAHATIADLLRFERRWRDAEDHYLRAIELEPNNSTAYLWYSEQLVATGRLEAALDAGRKAVDLDPFHPGTNSMFGYACHVNGDDQSAVRHAEAAWDLGHPWSIYELIDYNLDSGNLDAAERIANEHRARLEADDFVDFDLYLLSFRDPEAGERFLEDLVERSEGPRLFSAIDHARLGHVDEALQIALDVDPSGADLMDIWRPRASAMRQHVRFGEFIRAAGLDVFWNEVGWPSQCRSEGEQIYCD